jgi:tRNA(Ile)-lysidine synthase
MSCIDTVRDYICTHRLIAPGSRVLAAVSGGPDSMALMTILSELSAEMRLDLAVAHYDHGIRPEAAREKALVERYAARLSVPLFLGSGNVPAEARRTKKGLEETARLLRYRFLEETARMWNADSVPLGHTSDDQVETILHHVIRGSGWRGLRGIPAQRGVFVRPLLACSREDLKTLLRSRRVRYAIDRSNFSGAYLRNRLRNRLLPHLEKNYNPSIRQALLRLSENLAEGWETLEKPVARLIPRSGAAPEIGIALEKIARLTDFQLYLFIDILLRERFGVSQDIERSHFDAAKRLIRSHRSGKQVHLPHGIVAGIEHSNLIVRSGGEDRSNPGEAIIPGTGSYELPWWNLTAAVERVNAKDIDPRSSATEAYFAGIVFPIRVRARKPGDRVAPFGMRGTKKLSDLLIDRKIPLSRREAIPVFEDGRGVFWLPGIAVGERSRITGGTRHAVHITLFRAAGEK